MTRSWFFDPLQMFRYDLIVIDPPWDFELRSDKGAEKSQHKHYSTMTDREIKTMPVGHLAAPDCLLMCWATSPRLPVAIEIVEAWGFVYKSIRMWRKTTAGGKVRMGTGYRVRTTGEPVIVAAVGNPKQSTVPHTIFDGLAREHSRKPDEFYAECERIMPNAYRADVFGRQSRPGWDVFGNEATKFDGEAA